MDQDSNMAPRSPALERGLAVIETIAQQSGVATFKDLQDATVAPKSSLIRLLAVLRRGGWVERDEDGYRAGKRLVALRSPVNLVEQLRAAAVPVLSSLRDSTGNTAICLRCEADTTIVIAKALHESSVAMREVGSVDEISWNSPWCWLQMAEMSADRRESLKERLNPNRRLVAAATRAWRSVKQTGWCYDDQVGIPLVRRLAAPIRDPSDDRLIGIVALGGNPLTIPDDRVDQIAGALVKAAGRLSRL